MTPDLVLGFLIGAFLGGGCTWVACRSPKVPEKLQEPARLPGHAPPMTSELVQYLLERVEEETKSQYPGYVSATACPTAAQWNFPDFTIVWALHDTRIIVTERPQWCLSLEPGSVLEKSVHARWPSSYIPCEIAPDAWLIAKLKASKDAYKKSLLPSPLPTIKGPND